MKAEQFLARDACHGLFSMVKEGNWRYNIFWWVSDCLHKSLQVDTPSAFVLRFLSPTK
jgi:hypothetical protein